MPDKPRSAAEIALAKEALQYVPAWLRYRQISQRAVAEHLAKSEATVSKWLRGEQAMTVSQFVQLAQLLKARPTDLLGSPDEMEKTDRLRQLAQIALSLPSHKLDLLIQTGQAMQPTHDPES